MRGQKRKNMKKTLLTLTIILGATLMGNAQEIRRAVKPTPEKMTERMNTDLELSEDQYDAVFNANKELIDRIDEAGGRDAEREVLREIHDDYFASLEETLNEKQMAQVKEHHEMRRERRRERAMEKEGKL